MTKDIQDGETKTINWLLQMDDASDGDAAASQPDCSHVVTVSARPSEAEVTVVPHAVCEILNTPGPSVIAAQLPSPPPSEHVMSRTAPSQPSAADAQKVPSPVHATDTQPGALTQDQAVCTQPPPLCTRAGRPIKPPARLICEINKHIVDDSVSTVDSLFSLVRNMFSG